MDRVLAFGCHPDDVEFMAAGTLAILADKGYEIHVATMTGGEVGHPTKTRQEIHKALFEAHVPCAPVMKLAEVVNDPHHLARGMLQDISHPQKGSVRVFGNPIRFSDSKPLPLQSSPLLGQDNEAIYMDWLGLRAEEVKALKEQKVI